MVDDKGLEEGVLNALQTLADPAVFAEKYHLAPGLAPLLFAMGDGNHSLATAKAIWEQLRPQVSGALAHDHPARYALVEVENIHDAGLEFEPILRVLFDVREDVAEALHTFYGNRARLVTCADAAEMTALVDGQGGEQHLFGIVTSQGCQVATISDPPSNLPVGTLQYFLDAWEQRGGFGKIDYVHGVDVTLHLGAQPGRLGFYLPAIAKSALFKTVIVDGALPRKTFSMGEAKEKRFYMEARRIV